MMASSARAVLTGHRNDSTRVYVIIITIILLELSISVESSIFGVRERLTAIVGKTINIPFEYCGLPKPSCTLTQSFNLSAPNPTCTVDRYGHCEVAPAPDDDPIRDQLNIGCELCVLVIHGVTQKDAGPYAICQTSGACTSSFWSTISTLKVVLEPADPKSYPRSAEIGQVGYVVYEVFQRGDLPEHICFPNEYNCTTPHGMCSDDHDKYQLVVVTDPVTQGDGHQWFCGIKIEGVSLNDVGFYKICKLVGGAQTIHGGVEHQNLHINFAAWEIDSHGRICQTSYDETSNELVNNCTSLSTTPQLTTTEERETASSSTMTVKPSPVLSTKYTERVGNLYCSACTRGRHLDDS